MAGNSRGNPNWKKGVCPNPGGRPKGTSVKVLLDAIEEVEKDKGINYWKKVIEKSLATPSLMIAVMKKIIPDQVEGSFVGAFSGFDFK